MTNLSTRNDCARVAHPAAGRRRHAGDERHHRLRVRAGILVLKHKGKHINERIQFQINILF